MKLNNDCIRDILIQVEEANLGYKLTIKDLTLKLPQYTEEDIIYSCLKLGEANFLSLDKTRYIRDNIDTIHKINSITYSGHQFLDIIRNDNVWNKTKSTLKSMGASSIKTIFEIALKIIEDKI